MSKLVKEKLHSNHRECSLLINLLINEDATFIQARPLLSDALETGEFESLVDLKLGKKYIDTEMFCMIEVAAACVRHSAAKRPHMGQVVRAFESLETSDFTNGMRVGESQAFDSAQQSEELRLFQRMAFGSQNYRSDFFNHSSLHM